VKKNCLIILFLIASLLCHAQRSEVGTMIGTSFYFGDLNSIPFQNAKFAGGLVYRYNFSPRWALKANILFGKIAATDKKNHSLGKDANGNYFWNYKDRGLSFVSPISEISAQVEVNFFNVYNVSHLNQISPYLFGGVALFSFNPQAKYQDKIYNLQPIGTEGQGRERMPKKYPLTGFAIPFGIGFKANIGRYLSVGAEWGLRFTFTDYLDDVGGLYYDFSDAKIQAASKEVVEFFADPSAHKHTYNSQRYSTKKTDWYSFAGVIITVRIGNEDRICDIRTNVKLKHKQGKKR
jgi:hypothetical protein